MSKQLSDDPLDLGRFSQPGLLVMVSLCDGPEHGYAITDDIALFSGATLGPGTLYGTLARLEGRGLIRAAANGGSTPTVSVDLRR